VITSTPERDQLACGALDLAEIDREVDPWIGTHSESTA